MRQVLGGVSFSGPASEKMLTPAQVGAIELRSAARAVSLILEAAIRRTESRGSHLREDYPEQNGQNSWDTSRLERARTEIYGGLFRRRKSVRGSAKPKLFESAAASKSQRT